MKILLKHFIVLFALALAGNSSVADTLSIPDGQLSADTLGVAVPARWMTMQEVEDKFGTPLSKSNPVGDPPICYWVYDKYTVYFEKDKVLDTVRNLPIKK